ncbi:MAG: histidine kinase, partial [bacterium]|nr:histidine kinase [bacterium]
GTYGGGINKLVDPGSGSTFISYTRQDGLPNNVVHGILEDSMGFLWISTNIGLSRFDPVSETFINYTDKDGLQSNEFTGASFKSRSGEMFFGGINGFNAFYPQQVLKNLYVPPIVITGIKVYEDLEHSKTKPGLYKELPNRGEILLTPKTNTFSIQFTALDYTNPMKNQYAYMLEGFNKDWIYLGNQREVVFTGLAPGEY